MATSDAVAVRDAQGVATFRDVVETGLSIVVGSTACRSRGQCTVRYRKWCDESNADCIVGYNPMVCDALLVVIAMMVMTVSALRLC